MLTQTILAGQKAGALDAGSLKRVAVDTTIMEKTIAHPTDARLYERARAQLVALAVEAGVELRQSYARLAPRLAVRVGRYAHAKQFKRMRKALRTLKGYTGRVLRDLRERILDRLVLVSRLLSQEPKGRDKIYALHEPEVDCIPAQLRERSLRSLYCSSDGVRGRGAPVTNLSHSASFHSFERIAPSNRGIKHLACLCALN
ncbi:hypothetical protein C8J30_12226 [Rhodobacter viridis]|uniref:IS5 family transposase n=1 Tax=Rhodobacter viridis TaxID=1054202 RepID=A0A318TRI6_9RHOB|nr:hypothetical protein C8J30_12226 [Rhodobacter viridis]